jgi:hypothetical protein
MGTCTVTSLYISSGVSVHPAPESTASDPNPRCTFMAKISLDFCRYVAYLTAHIEREPRQPAWFGKARFPSSLSTLDEAVARKPFLAMTTINASPGVRSKRVYADSRRSGCVARYGARTRGGNRPEESISLVLCQSILLWEYRAGTSRC